MPPKVYVKPKFEETKSPLTTLAVTTSTLTTIVPTTTRLSLTDTVNNYGNNNYLEDSNDIFAANSISHRCYYEKEVYEDGMQWKSQFDDCQMCSCQRGRVKCEQMMCPVPSCANPVTLRGECCAVCEADTSSLMASNTSEPRLCYFEGEKKYHVVGSKWHPYIPPFGFDKCSICTCLSNLTIKCERIVTCPPLPCPDYEAYRENAMDCCKRCPNAIPVKSVATLDQLGDQRASSGWLKSPNELLSAGGCALKGRVYANGDEWHPTVQPFGEVKCVRCRCKVRYPRGCFAR
ncbi:chordin-like protein [Dinothrombium tinctorium]|uniref:Chordin-like protein n=1 Tax=Dinothrombium tinctorium TaxID=1965070 RepID=A0A3S3PE98_9ACAR|nr:chordin-like protein [Dinothrombium tinctorium]